MALFSSLNNGDDLNTNVRRVGSRRPGPTAPNGESLGDIWYDTTVLSLKVWNGSAWVGVASSGGSGTSYITPGLEIYHPSSTPYIDFHRAASPAGDSNADFNVRLINDANNVLRILGTINDVRFESNIFRVGTYVPDNSWAQFGHKDRMNVSSISYQFMANTSGAILVNASNANTGQLVYNGNGILTWGADTVTGRGIGMNDHAIHHRGITDNSHRMEYQGGVDAVNWTMNSNIRMATTSLYVIQFTTGGEVISRFQDGNSRTRLGSWPANGVYGGLFNQNRLDNNGSHYMMMTSLSDDDMYTSASGGLGAIIWRRANNGLTQMSVGVNNRTMSIQDTIDMPVPALGGGNTLNLQAGSSWQVGYVASTEKFKKNIRSLRETPELDAAEHNPIFKMKVKRFNWKQDENDPKKGWQGKGVANGDELNARFPNGVVGLLAEEVELLAPDCVLHGGKDAEPWDVNNPEHGPLPWIDPDTGKPTTHTKAWPHGPVGIDNDRLIAYLIDALQHVKEESDLLKEEIKKIKEKVIL